MSLIMTLSRLKMIIWVNCDHCCRGAGALRYHLNYKERTTQCKYITSVAIYLAYLTASSIWSNFTSNKIWGWTETKQTYLAWSDICDWRASTCNLRVTWSGSSSSFSLLGKAFSLIGVLGLPVLPRSDKDHTLSMDLKTHNSVQS